MREVGISAQLIGLLLLANAATVAVAQVPISVFAEGRRRAVMMALAGWMFLGACLLVLAQALAPTWRPRHCSRQRSWSASASASTRPC